MLEYLNSLDTDLLLWINGAHNPFLDSFMWHYSQSRTWIPLYLVIIAWVVYKWRWNAVWVILAIVAAVGLSDFIASSVFKPTVARLRPSHVPELQGVLHLVNGYRGGMFGFMSSHASNTFALAISIFLFTHRSWAAYLLLVWAALNAYSRMYLGVHYPLDILCGAALGWFMAWLMYKLCVRLRPQTKQAAEQ